MEFLASRRASVHWTPMDYAGWAVRVSKLRCIGLKTHLFTHTEQAKKENSKDKERVERKQKEKKIHLWLISFYSFLH